MNLVLWLQPSLERRVQERLVQIEAGRLESFKQLGHVHQALLCTCPEHAERAGHSQVSTLRLCAPSGFINQEQIGMHRLGECDRRPLTGVPGPALEALEEFGVFQKD